MPKRATDVDRRLTDPNRIMAATLLASGVKLDDVCAQCGISPATLHRYRDEPTFIEMVDTKSKELFRQLLPKAVERLNELLDSPNQGIRVKAVKLVLDKTLPNLAEVDSKNLSAVKVQVQYV